MSFITEFFLKNGESKRTLLLGAFAFSLFSCSCDQSVVAPQCEPGSTDPGCAEEDVEPPEPPRIFVDPPFGIGFECVTIGCDQTQSFIVENRGDGLVAIPLVRLSVDSSTDFSVTYTQVEDFDAPPIVVNEESPIVLSGGEQVSINVRYVPSNASSDEGTLWIDWYDGNLDYEEAVIERVEMDITTRVLGEPLASLESAELNFGFAELGETKSLPIRVRNDAEGTAILEVSKPQPTAGTPFEFEIVGEQQLVNPGEFAEFMVNFTPIELRAYEGAFEITTSDTGNSFFSVRVGGTAFRNPFFSVESPSNYSLEFGDIRVGEERQQEIVVKNLGGQPLQITPSMPVGVAEGYSIDANLDVPMPAIPPLARRTIEVTSVPNIGGPISGTLALATNDPGVPNDAIALSTYGIAPDANFDVSGLDFGDVVQSWQSEAQTVALSNPGTGDLTVSEISFELGSSSQVQLVSLPTLPFKIDPGAEPLLISIFVQAQTLGEANATLLVTTDAIEEPVKRLPITANVVSCEEGCPTPNGTPACGSGQCEIAACFDTFHDTDGVADTGCECTEDLTPNGRIDLGDFCSSGARLGTLNDRDNPRSVTRIGTLHDGNDVDLYTFRANDNSQFLTDDYRASVRLDFGPPGLELCTRFADAGTGCGGENQRNCGGTRYSGRGNSASDNSEDVTVWVQWAEGAEPVCGEYQLCMSANEDRCR